MARRQRRPTSVGDVVRVLVGAILLGIGLIIWVQHADDLGVMLDDR